MDPFKSVYQTDYTAPNPNNIRGRRENPKVVGEGTNDDFRTREGNIKDCPTKKKEPDRRQSDVRIPGPFWNRQKSDETKGGGGGVLKVCRTSSSELGPDRMKDRSDRKQESDSSRKRKYISQQEGNSQKGPADQFRMQERSDERREPEIDRKKKFGKQRIEAAEVIHGEEFMYSGRKDEENDDSGDEDQAQPFPYTRPCKCSPAKKTNKRESWGQENYPAIPEDVEKTIRHVPEARISCAPAAETSKFDQPNTFMRKLYEKYPYLYQVLKETPPEELVSKVFKDRFLSTYQVDYLHLGIGKEQFPGGGAERDEKYEGPDGEEETKVIPGCSYRFSKKGDFGRKKTVYEKKEKEEEIVEVEKEEPRISEYMATISKLGGEIISDQLYKVEHLTKAMKNQYNNL